jgi:hypothetical protein
VASIHLYKLCLQSRRPGNEDWMIRNDRFLINSYGGYDKAFKEATIEMNAWQAVEPDTQFRIQPQDVVGNEVQLPRA